MEEGLSIRAIARAVDRSPATVRHWLKRYGLRTRPARYAPRGTRGRLLRECPVHGWVEYVRAGGESFRCPRCVAQAVSAATARGQACPGRRGTAGVRRLRVRPLRRRTPFPPPGPGSTKPFNWAAAGWSARSPRLRSEAQKCVLLCANCHAEVEVGAAGALPRLPMTGRSDRSGVAQWQSIRLLIEGLWVRVPPPEPHRRPPERGRSSFRDDVVVRGRPPQRPDRTVPRASARTGRTYVSGGSDPRSRTFGEPARAAGEEPATGLNVTLVDWIGRDCVSCAAQSQ